MGRSFVHLAATSAGGAGSAAERLHAGLLAAGHRSRMIIHMGRAADETVVKTATPLSSLRTNASKTYFRLASRGDYYFRNQDLDNFDLAVIRRHVVAAQPDAIVSHFITGFLSFPDVRELQLATGAPVLWFLMDMASFTGGCHYSWSCRGYEAACGNCPALYLSHHADHSARTLRRKSASLEGMHGAVVAGSTWLADQARASSLFGNHRIEMIPIGVSPETFRPGGKAELRGRLGVEAARPAIVFGARSASDRRKGMGILREALVRLSATHPAADLPTLLIVGDASPFESLAGLGFPVRALGQVGPDSLAAAYAAADVFISPSIEDSGPMMVNEAVMSGTPVIAFPIGVAIDLVQPGVTGELAALGNAESLSAALSRMLGWSPAQRENASRAARAFALETMSPAAQAERIAELAGDLKSSSRP